MAIFEIVDARLCYIGTFFASTICAGCLSCANVILTYKVLQTFDFYIFLINATLTILFFSIGVFDHRIGAAISTYLVFILVHFADAFPHKLRAQGGAACGVVLFGVVASIATAVALKIIPNWHEQDVSFLGFTYDNTNLTLMFAAQSLVSVVHFLWRAIKEPDSYVLLRSNMHAVSEDKIQEISKRFSITKAEVKRKKSMSKVNPI